MDGKTRVCGLIANPVEHSMSPMMHNFFAQRTGVNLAYVPFKVEEDRVGDAVKGAYALNILGMNVTVPHKQRVMDFCSPALCQHIGCCLGRSSGSHEQTVFPLYSDTSF